MVNEELLATYSLLSYIRENLGEDRRDTLAYVFLPLVGEGISAVLSKHGFKEVKGKDYTEIQSQISDIFKIEIPIPVLKTIMPIISNEAGEAFHLYGDHSFIIKSKVGSTIMGDYGNQKKKIQQLQKNYNAFCKGQGVQPDFDGLISFIQDQNNRLFEKGFLSKIEDQSYHISKYIDSLMKKKNTHYDTVCNLYLGGIISSYLKFQAKQRIVDTDLLIDTNFYISLVNLNTEESYATCKQLYDLTVAMGYRYKILDTTISQIRILLNNKLSNYNNKDIYSTLDHADILAACERRNLNYSDLQAYKDGLLEDLRKKGITTIYKSNIPQLVEKVKKSKELKPLVLIRRNEDSAFNDLLAQAYVEYKRHDIPITEFIDVNCWFLTNSYSINKTELSLPVWKRHSINASDLLVLLWYANPSLNIGKEKAMLAATSMSANVLRYRTEKLPTEKVIKDLTHKIDTLQKSGHITENTLAKLCIRMSEGCIDNTEAERLVTLTTADFVEYVNNIQERDAAYTEEHEYNEQLLAELAESKKEALEEKVKGKINTMRAWSIVYVLTIIGVYVFATFYIERIPNAVLKYLAHGLYWLLTTIVVNWFSHSYFLDGLVSLFNYQLVYDKHMKLEKGNNDSRKN